MEPSLKEALSQLDRLIQHAPNAFLWLQRAKINHSQKSLVVAAADCLNAIQYDAQSAEIWGVYSQILIEQKHWALAQEAVINALKLRPDFAPGFRSLGNICLEQGLFSEALEAYQKSLQLNPSNNQLWCEVMQLIQYLPNAETHTRNAQRLWIKHLPSQPHSTHCPSSRGTLIRIGFLSGNWLRHPVTAFSQGLFEHIDRTRFTLVLVFNNRLSDDVTEAFQSLADESLDISKMTDTEAVQAVRSLSLNYLIEMDGYGAHTRLPLFAHRMAGYQLSWGGHFCSSGIPAMDGFISDPIQTPIGFESDFSEDIWRLPNDYICYRPPEYAPETTEAPFRKNGYVTFGSLNHFKKLNLHTLTLWAKILKAVPRSRLLLQYAGMTQPAIEARIRAVFDAAQIQPERIVLRGASDHNVFLATYNEIDLALDPFPYSGGLTTCEALWMGVPVLTLPHRSFASRHSAAHLHQVNLDDWAVSSETAYAQRAIEIGLDPAAFLPERHELRAAMKCSPLCDAAQFAHDFSHLIETHFLRLLS
jgi:predicted O-linked N-acetylglucosamine transferase (SPINDLY family)